MKTQLLGGTGLQVSRLGLGLAALGRPGYINLGHAQDLERDYDTASMQRRAHAVLDAAWAGGVRYFDAARSYGRSEEFLASWLARRDLDANELVVGSKWGYRYTAEWQVQAAVHEKKDHDVGVLEGQLAESRARLGEHLDLYQIHSATLETGVLENDAVLDRLARLRDEGVAVGLSSSGPQQTDTLRRALDVRRGGKPLFQCVQATWNLLERSAAPALAEAHEAGLGVIVKEALANGRLTTRNTDERFAKSRVLLGHEAARLDTTMDALALAAALAQPWCDVVLSGAATPPQLLQNLQAPNVAWDDVAGHTLADIAETPELYWTLRKQLPWN